MRIIDFIEEYKVIKKILDWLRICGVQRKRPPITETSPGEFGEYIWDDYINCQHWCQSFYRVAG
ncbi:MAG: hypothetical protein ACQEP2_09360 [Actinomycetota bacterium]